MIQQERLKVAMRQKRMGSFARTPTKRVRAMFLSLIALALTIVTLSTLRVSGQVSRMMIPASGGQADFYSVFTAGLVTHAKEGDIKILVLPIALASDPNSISQIQRQDYLNSGEQERAKIEDACLRIVGANRLCTIILAPIFVRDDALNPNNLSLFSSDLTAIIFLDGDQGIAIDVINGTPVEVALTEAYDRGVIIAGDDSGGAILSASMLAGYQPGFSAYDSMQFGAVDVWNSAERHGLPFGLRLAIIDPQFYVQNRVGRLINRDFSPRFAPCGDWY